MDNYKDKIKQKKIEQSKASLHSIFSKRMQTTMIGALSSIEEHFGFLWDSNQDQREYFYDLYQKLRSDILDKGNAQLRALESEINKYDISPKIFTLRLPIRLTEEDKENE